MGLVLAWVLRRQRWVGTLLAAATLGAHGAPAAAALGARPHPTWMTNGPVRAMARSGNVLWIGGQFSQLREKPPGQGGRVIAVSNLAALDARSGRPIAGLSLPAVTGPNAIVYALRVARGQLYVGGLFDSVAGARRTNLARVDAASGRLDATFHPVIGTVWSLASDGSRLYVGGGFLRVDGQTRTRLAAFDLPAGTLDSGWRPAADDRVRDLALDVRAGALFAVGNFKHVAGPDGVWQARNSVARIALTAGKVAPWVAGCPCSTSLDGLGVAVGGTRVYVGMGGSDWVAAYSVASGRQIWRTDTNGQAQDVAIMGERLIVGGHFTLAAPTSGVSYDCYHHPSDCVSRIRLAAFSLDGVLDGGWAPPMTGAYPGVWHLLVYGTRLWAGGAFTHASGVDQERLALFAG